MSLPRAAIVIDFEMEAIRMTVLGVAMTEFSTSAKPKPYRIMHVEGEGEPVTNVEETFPTMFPNRLPIDRDAHDDGRCGALGHLQPNQFLGRIAGSLQPVTRLLVRIRRPLTLLWPHSMTMK